MYSPLSIGSCTARLPIVQGGMGVGVSLSGLAGAVAACGGVGTISGIHPGYRDPDFAADPVRANLRAIGSELAKARQIAPDGVIGFNFMTVMNHYDDYVREAIAQGADFIVSGAGLPTGLAKLAAGSRTAILPIVSSARALRLIVKRWLQVDRLPDAVVVEGPLAGGHLGFAYDDVINGTEKPLEACLTEVLDYVRELENTHGVQIPVIAGGGVRTYADVTRLMGLGASGVQVGTRFVTTVECDAADSFKSTYVAAKKRTSISSKARSDWRRGRLTARCSSGSRGRVGFRSRIATAAWGTVSRARPNTAFRRRSLIRSRGGRAWFSAAQAQAMRTKSKPSGRS